MIPLYIEKTFFPIHEFTLPFYIKTISYWKIMFKDFPLDMIRAQIYHTFFSFLEELAGAVIIA